jgi:hypothetical protein
MLKDQIPWGEDFSTRAASMNKCNWRPGKEFSWDQAEAERPQSIRYGGKFPSVGEKKSSVAWII